MLDYRLDDETEALRKTVREFADGGRRPADRRVLRARRVPDEIVRQMGELGLFGLPFPEEYGGSGGDYFALCLALEELARVDSARSRSPSRPASRWARCRSTGSAPRSRSRSGCRGCAPGEALGRVRADRARRRLGRRRDADHRAARGRRTG